MSVVLVASWGRQLWYDVGGTGGWSLVVLLASRGRLSSLLLSEPWSLKPTVV